MCLRRGSPEPDSCVPVWDTYAGPGHPPPKDSFAAWVASFGKGQRAWGEYTLSYNLYWVAAWLVSLLQVGLFAPWATAFGPDTVHNWTFILDLALGELIQGGEQS